jgi:transposase
MKGMFVKIPEQLHRKVKLRIIEMGITMSKYTETALKNELNREKMNGVDEYGRLG